MINVLKHTNKKKEHSCPGLPTIHIVGMVLRVRAGIRTQKKDQKKIKGTAKLLMVILDNTHRGRKNNGEIV